MIYATPGNRNIFEEAPKAPMNSKTLSKLVIVIDRVTREICKSKAVQKKILSESFL